MIIPQLLRFLTLVATVHLISAAPPPDEISVTGYPSIQEAIKANPGRMLYVPSGDYKISAKIRLHTDNSGLFGPGRIIQTNPDAAILEIEHGSGIRVRDLTLTRSEGQMDTNAEGIFAHDCRNLRISDVQVLDNRTKAAAISLRECRTSQVRDCLVQNYMRITIDDRTASQDWGYAFNCIDGTGISTNRCEGTLIQGCRVLEYNLLPTRENKEKYKLGDFVKRNPQKGTLLSQKVWDAGYVDNWHQGSAIVINSPEASDHTQVLGNYIENAAQGLDIHADHVTIAQNIVNNAFMGMKAMHGSRNVIIIGNQFSKNDLWSIGLMPGAASHAAAPTPEGGKPIPANVDGGSIIANNIISDFGYGNAHWIWADGGGTPIRFDSGQKPDNPPLRDVIVQGNIVYDTGRDQIIENGQPKVEPPRYVYAVRVTHEGSFHFSNNIFHPGTKGVSNVELKP